MDANEYRDINNEVATRPNALSRGLGVCRKLNSSLIVYAPQVGDYATLYAKSEKEIPIGATDGRIKVRIDRIANGRFYGVVCDSHYDNPMPLGGRVSFSNDRIFSISDL